MIDFSNFILMKHFFFLTIKQKINLFLTLSHLSDIDEESEQFSHCFERFKDNNNNNKKVSSKKYLK